MGKKILKECKICAKETKISELNNKGFCINCAKKINAKLRKIRAKRRG